MEYVIRRAKSKPALDGNWDGQTWANAETLKLTHYYRDKEHKPIVNAKLLFDDDGLYIMFRVEDRYIRSLCTQYQQQVCCDSCVEFFVQPSPDAGYFNFEMNCGGTMLLYYIQDQTRTKTGFEKYTEVTNDWLDKIIKYHSMPDVVEPEIETPTTWINAYFVPFDLFKAYITDLPNPAGQTWRGNFFKCADKTSHPHWLSWSLVDEPLNFHRPECFSALCFDK